MRFNLTRILAFSVMFLIGCEGTLTNSGGDTSSDTGSSAGSSAGSGSGSSGSAPSQAINVNLGPTGQYTNGIFTSVTICSPGTASCQTIDNILVDSGSFGLRLLASAETLALPVQTNGSSEQIAECAVFADGFTWGPVASSDVYLGGQLAGNVAINLIGESEFAGPPSDCSSGAGQQDNTLATLGANGILGIGVFAEDCGDTCAQTSSVQVYFACTKAGVCEPTTESLTDQVTNPVALLSENNNGVIIRLPSISTSGAATVSGTLIFGIGTQSGNGLGAARVLTVDDDGNFTTKYSDTLYTSSFIDSGSNALFFASSIVVCADNAGFYCPSSNLSLTAVMTGENGTSVTVPFLVADADKLNGNNAAFDDLAGPVPSTIGGAFDWGLPFFFGRSVYFAIENENTPGGEGPYVAF